MRILIATITLVFSLAAWSQPQTLAYWAQNDNDLLGGGFGFTPASFPQPADVGEGFLVLRDFNEATNASGVYSFIASFGGDTANALPGFAAGGSLSPQGGADNANNGMSIDIEVDTTDFENIQVSWAQRGTATGFNVRRFFWSADGETFTEFAVDQGALSASWQVITYNLSSVQAVADNPSAVFRITLDGATNVNGNNRFDNILVQGSPIGSAPRFTAYAESFAADPFARGWQDQNLVGNQVWRWAANFSNVEMNGFVSGQGCLANDNWLISPALDFADLDNADLGFVLSRNFSGGPLQVLFSRNYSGSGSPLAADWELLDTIDTSMLPQTNTSVQFGPYDGFDDVADAGYIAFRYDSTDTGAGCAAWRVVNVEITADVRDDDTAPVFACGADATRIHSIQGPGFTSPLLGQTVQVEAIVVGEFQSSANGGLGGFYLQEADAHQDDNPLTSEGIFVADASLPVARGDVVRVAGSVTESFTETRIANVTDIAVCDSGRLADTSPAALTLPVDDLIELEALEGMWVQTAQPLTVTEVFNAARFGEVQVSSGRLFQPTQIVEPGAAAQALQAANDLNRIIIDDARDGNNRLPFINGEDGETEIAADNPIRGGYTVEPGFEGLMSFAFDRYRLHPLASPIFDPESNARPAAPGIMVQGNLRIATYNVENLFTTLSVPGSQCGPNQLSCRGAATESELGRQLAKIVTTIQTMDADVLALIEIENDADDRTLRRLVSALNRVESARDWRYVPTGFVGTDAIKPAFIYRASRARPEGRFAVLDQDVDPRFDATRQRPALAQTFRAWNSGKFTAVAVHLRSKGSCPGGSPAGNPNADQGDGQSCWNEWRRLSAEALVDWLETDPTGSGDGDMLILGDFNAYAQEDPMFALESAGYINLGIRANGDDAALYSFVFFGQAGALDHAMASPSLAEQVIDAVYWPINADEIPAFNYSEGTLPGGFAEKPESFFNVDPFRSSDHDPLVIEVELKACAPGIANRPQHPRGKILRVPRC